jgi:formylglycine-generating enzyme required for sulfatase activity
MKKEMIIFTAIFIFLTVALTSLLSPCEASTNEITIDLGGGMKLEMVRIPAGTFQMGSNDYDCEKPVHSVTISKDFYIGKYEVTQAQWEKIMGNNPGNFKKGGGYPVEKVSWNDICEKNGFLDKINQLKPGGYSGFRLPTEAEWEYSCRAGTITKHYWGDKVDSAYCWYWDNSSSTTHPVGEKKPNAWGLYDMSGNVWEWCRDSSDNINGLVTDTYVEGIVDPLCNAGKNRVVRGGSWITRAPRCRSSFRSGDDPSRGFDEIGFRLALSSGQ